MAEAQDASAVGRILASACHSSKVWVAPIDEAREVPVGRLALARGAPLVQRSHDLPEPLGGKPASPMWLLAVPDGQPQARSIAFLARPGSLRFTASEVARGRRADGPAPHAHRRHRAARAPGDAQLIDRHTSPRVIAHDLVPPVELAVARLTAGGQEPLHRLDVGTGAGELAERVGLVDQRGVERDQRRVDDALHRRDRTGGHGREVPGDRAHVVGQRLRREDAVEPADAQRLLGARRRDPRGSRRARDSARAGAGAGPCPRPRAGCPSRPPVGRGPHVRCRTGGRAR